MSPSLVADSILNNKWKSNYFAHVALEMQGTMFAKGKQAGKEMVLSGSQGESKSRGEKFEKHLFKIKKKKKKMGVC